MLVEVTWTAVRRKTADWLSEQLGAGSYPQQCGVCIAGLAIVAEEMRETARTGNTAVEWGLHLHCVD